MHANAAPEHQPAGPNIGTLKLPHPFIQAALSGFSDLPMRRISRRFGAAYAVNEMVLDRSVTHESDWQKRLLTVPDDDHPVGAQLMGADPETFAPAAERLVDAGYDVIDINFGCPVSHIMNKCRGGFLLSEPETAIAIIKSVTAAVGHRVPVTVKMRRGIDDTEQSRAAFFDILDAAYHNGASAVTVHARTVEQRYTGQADWSFLARVKERAGDRTVFGSGDLFTAADCHNMIKQTGVDAVTIARGSLGNPWIFQNCLNHGLESHDGQNPRVGTNSCSGRPPSRPYSSDQQPCSGPRPDRPTSTNDMPPTYSGRRPGRPTSTAGIAKASEPELQRSAAMSSTTVTRTTQRHSTPSADSWQPTAPSLTEQKRVIEDHLIEIINYYDPHAAPKVFARVAFKYTQHHPTPRKLRAALTKAKCISQFQELIDLWYDATQ